MTWLRRLPIPSWQITASLIPVAGIIWAAQIHRHTRAVDATRIQRFDGIPDAFFQSHTISSIVNPNKYRANADSRLITIEISSHHRNVPDEALLARFVQGYFGGVVISIERTFLQLLGRNMIHLNRNAIPTSLVQEQIWRTRQLSDEKLPPLHSIIYGVFQVLEIQLAPEKDDRLEKGVTESYIDFGFGSDRFIFAGAHRFSIVRQGEKSDSGQELIQIHYHSTACNPTQDKGVGPGILLAFHKAYAEYLFRNGVARVLDYTQEV